MTKEFDLKKKEVTRFKKKVAFSKKKKKKNDLLPPALGPPVHYTIILLYTAGYEWRTHTCYHCSICMRNPMDTTAHSLRHPLQHL